MDDFPAKIADLLESVANRVRSMTVDRIAGVAKWTAVGLVLLVMGSLIALFLLFGLFRLIGELIGFELTYALLGGLFVIAGMFLWSKRVTKPVEED